MTIMARTKKQTLENASERKRQIQEEILRETLAAKQRKESLLCSQTHAPSKGNNPTMVAGGASALPQNGLAVCGSSDGSVGAVARVVKTESMKDIHNSAVNSTAKAGNLLCMASQPRMSGQAQVSSAMNQGDLPKAVICIPDIYRSPSHGDEPSAHGSRDSSPRGQGSRGKSSSATGHISDFEHGSETSLQRHDSPKRQAGRNSSSDHVVSLQTLEASSEKIRKEKRKSQQRSSSSSPNRASTKPQTSSPGRRSPRQHSPSSSSESQTRRRSQKTRVKSSRRLSDEKPKVNIFTDNLGVDLGKRIRSPRRLSEDMIALPIFSARRWSNCPKDNNPASAGGVGNKAAEDVPISDGTNSPSAHGNPESFKYPGTSPSPSKKSNSSGSPQKSPSSSSSKNSSVSGSPQRTPPSTGKKSNSDSVPPRRHRSAKSRENSPSGDHARSEVQEIEDSNEEKPSKSYPLRNSKPLVSRELQYSEETKPVKKPTKKPDILDDKIASDDSTGCSSSSNSNKMEDPISPLSLSDGKRKVGIKVKKDKSKKVKQEVEELMSSICRELMTDVVITTSDDRIMDDRGDAIESCVKIEEKSEENRIVQSSEHKEKNAGANNLDPVEKKADDGNLTSLASVEKTVDECSIKAKNGHETESKTDPLVENVGLGCSLVTVEEKPQSSLLCAMLVGGTDVTNFYTQERERCKPQVIEVSDSETGIHKPVVPSEPGLINLPSPPSKKLKHPSAESLSMLTTTPTTDAHPNTQEPTSGNETPSDCFNRNQTNSGETDVEVKSEIEEAKEIICKIEGAGAESDTEESTGIEKKPNLNLTGKLQKLDENVLKLMDIDVEEEFLKDLEVDDTPEPYVFSHAIRDPQSGAKDGESNLFSLISSLGSRLREHDNGIPMATPVDIVLVEKLMQSCPKNTPDIVPKLKSVARLEKLQQRLREEAEKESRRVKTKHSGEKGMLSPSKSQGIVEQGMKSLENPIIDNEEALKIGDSSVGTQHDSIDRLVKTEAAVGLCSDTGANGSLESLPSAMTTSTSSLNDSLCDLDLEAMTTAVTDIVSLGTSSENGDVDVKGSITQSSSCQSVEQSKDDEEPANRSQGTTARRSFMKAKTCDDFKEGSSSSSTTPVALRRINSSPQINAKLSSSPASAMFSSGKETHVKSKLGSKIPVPGTSYTSRSMKKTWRTPRIIKEPRPLSVLSELEETSAQPQNIFTCVNLQKYLILPSNRVIVPPEKKEEMQRLDAQAMEEEERREQKRKEREEKENKNEEEIMSDYLKCEPDFDEVDGMLFMSFSNEVELAAHVRVEKALDWDKDDTMLRISRAKAFEEAKAHNEDMGDFKLKHLRGQHMRWKKYRRLYSSEVKAMLDAKEKGIPYETVLAPKKTSDVTKIKGWKKKQAQEASTTNAAVDQNLTIETPNVSFEDSKDQSLLALSLSDDVQMLDEISTPEAGDKQMSLRTKRRQGFSHQKAHKQLFRELNMDWEDRMIHRKLGGWSLKGNRPRAFSRAAQKRQEKESKETDATAVGAEIRDVSLDASNLEDTENETSPEKKDHNESPKKRKMIKMVYPLLTEKMARNALKTLETGDIRRGIKRKKKKHRQNSNSNLPALTLIAVPTTQPSVLTTTSELPATPQSRAATIGSSPSTNISTPPPHQLQRTTETNSTVSALVSSCASTPLQIDLHDEMVIEGVDIAAENVSSPSLADTSSTKSCSKPGCRYGCICHLCSVSEASTPAASPVVKPPTPACQKEYCCLGCICDSIDPAKPIPDPSHCGKPSCMLQCVCLESGGQDSNDDIPYLPSMRRRPKPGERFSNLPQRERTHRSAKNLDAITRKAMMLYETSEIYCEKVERVRKRPEATDTSVTTTVASQTQASGAPLTPHISVTCASETYDIELDNEAVVEDEDGIQTDTSFTAVNLTTSEATMVAASQVVNSGNFGSQYNRFKPKGTASSKNSKHVFVIDDVRQTLPNMEPSAHKRKRKSHPLSDEIFTSSTCARIQPFKYQNSTQNVSVPTISEDNKGFVRTGQGVSLRNFNQTSLDNSSGFQVVDLDHEPDHFLPKITSVQTLAPGSVDISQWEDTETGASMNESEKTNSGTSLDVATSKMSAQLQLQANHQGSHSNTSSAHSPGSARHHGWHTSMVCLKARAAPSTQTPGEEDVQEEDEVKLLEFAANCNWEGAKKEILARVAQCLTRGQYPHPRTMNVCEFVVEILPKAHQPSLIPPALRAKLPGQMYSIRVRITRRESVRKLEDDGDIIDLSGPSPTKPVSSRKSGDLKSKLVVKNLNDSLSSSCKQQPSSLAVTSSLESSVVHPSSVGISGLSKLCISNSHLDQESLISGKQSMTTSLLKPSSAPNSRRASSEGTSGDKLAGCEPNSSIALTVHTLTNSGVSLKGSSFTRVEDELSLKATFNSFMGTDKVITTSVSSPPPVFKSATSDNRSITHTGKGGKVSTSATSRVSKTVHSKQPVISPFNTKDVKIVKIPGQEMMKLIEVGGGSDKNKKLIAVPFPLSKTSKPGAVPLMAVPVSGSGQNKLLPILTSQAVSSHLKTVSTTSPQQILLRIPNGGQNSTMSGVRHPVVLQPIQSMVKTKSQRFQVVPLPLGSNVTVSQSKAKVMPSSAQGSKITDSKPMNSNDEMIMVFDAAHIKASQLAKTSSTTQASVSKEEKEEVTAADKSNQSSSTSVTASRDRPIMSSAVSPSKSRSELNGAIDLTADNVASEDSQGESEDSKRSSHGFDECDGETSTPVVKECYTQLEVAAKELSEKSEKNCNSDTVILALPNSDKEAGNNIVSSVSATDDCDVKSIITISSSHTSSLNEANIDKGSEMSEEGVEKYYTIGGRISSSNIPKTASTTSKSFITACDNTPQSLYESIPTGSKRSLPPSPGEVDPQSLSVKKARLSTENPVTVDEDSLMSVNSVHAAQDGAERPKSVMSQSQSTSSSDDLVLLLSSEEEIDVGENDMPECFVGDRERAERALENDHGSMYNKMYSMGFEGQADSSGSQSDVEALVKKLGRKTKHLDKGEHHNQLERLRRSRLKTLFDELQAQVLLGKRVSKSHTMSKVQVLVEAKKVVLDLSKRVQQGDQQVKEHERKHKKLLRKLNKIRVHMIDSKIPVDTINAVLENASKKQQNQFSTQALESDLRVVHTLPVLEELSTNTEVEEPPDTVNLVSPSTDDDRCSDRPDVVTPTQIYEDTPTQIYEDISEAEDSNAPKHH